jgi:hypothetical protein
LLLFRRKDIFNAVLNATAFCCLYCNQLADADGLGR